MTAKVTPPFGTYPPKLCENPDCVTGPGNTRAASTPGTPWQRFCSPACRNHWHYLTKVKPARQKKSDKSGDQDSKSH